MICATAYIRPCLTLRRFIEMCSISCADGVRSICDQLQVSRKGTRRTKCHGEFPSIKRFSEAWQDTRHQRYGLLEGARCLASPDLANVEKCPPPPPPPPFFCTTLRLSSDNSQTYKQTVHWESMRHGSLVFVVVRIRYIHLTGSVIPGSAAAEDMSISGSCAGGVQSSSG